MASRRTFKLGMIQMRVSGGRRAENLRHATELIAQAAANGVQLVVLPEALNLGWTHPSAEQLADAIPHGESCSVLRAAAASHRLHVCAGLVERAADKVFNAAVLIAPSGDVILHHRKLNELEIGHELYAQGDRLGVAETPLGTVGLMICADAFARGQIVGRTLGLMGADIIVSPSAWAVPADHDPEREPYGKLWLDNYGPVARDFRLWIAGVSNVGWLTEGPWKGRQCIGCSLLIDHRGESVVKGPYGVDAETILYAEIVPEARPARGDGWERVWSQKW